MSTSVTITLPAAPREHYLDWMRYWRDVESVMLDHPPLADLAAAESGRPFIRDPVADYTSHDLVPQIVADAERVERGGLVSPTIEIDPEMASPVVGYVANRMRWLEEPGVQKALGVEPLPDEVVDLRTRVLVTIRDQITSYLVRRSL